MKKPIRNAAGVAVTSKYAEGGEAVHSVEAVSATVAVAEAGSGGNPRISPDGHPSEDLDLFIDTAVYTRNRFVQVSVVIMALQ